MTSSGIILCLPPWPQSVGRYPPLLETPGGGTVLKFVLGRFRAAMPSLPLIVLADTDWAEDTKLLGAARFYDCIVHSCSCRNRSLAVCSAAASAGLGLISLVSQETAVCPADAIAKAIAHHQAEGFTYTAGARFPEGCSLEVFDTSLLHQLACLPPQLAVAGLGNLVRNLQRAHATIGEISPDWIRIGSFSLPDQYSVAAERLPRAISFTDPDDLDTLFALAAKRPQAAAESVQTLIDWKQRNIAARGQKRRSASWRRHGDHLRVLYVSNASAYSGAEESLCQTIAGLTRRSVHAFALVGMHGRFSERLREVGAQTFTPNRDFGRATAASVRLLNDVIKETKPHLIHVNAPSGLAPIASAEFHGIPVVYHLRNANLGWYAEEWTAADAVIGVSQFIRQRACAFDISPARVHVVYDGIDTGQFAPGRIDSGESRARFNQGSNQFVIGMVARFTRYKRHDLAIAAAALLRSLSVDTRLLFVGECHTEPEYYDEIVQLIHQYGLDSSVRFLPFQDDIRYFHAAVDVLISCSDEEPLGTAVLESMAMGNTVVITNSGGLPELVEDGVTGCVVEPNNAVALADRIELLVRNEVLRKNIGGNAARYVHSRLNFERHAADILDVYETVAGGQTEPAPRQPSIRAPMEAQ